MRIVISYFFLKEWGTATHHHTTQALCQQVLFLSTLQRVLGEELFLVQQPKCKNLTLLQNAYSIVIEDLRNETLDEELKDVKEQKKVNGFPVTQTPDSWKEPMTDEEFELQMGKGMEKAVDNTLKRIEKEFSEGGPLFDYPKGEDNSE